jgi:hypothetical protein
MLPSLPLYQRNQILLLFFPGGLAFFIPSLRWEKSNPKGEYDECDDGQGNRTHTDADRLQDLERVFKIQISLPQSL